MNDTQCKIQMLDLYFSKYSFNHVRGKEDTEYSTSFNIEYAINSGDDTKVKVTIDTTIANSAETIKLDLQGESLLNTYGLAKDEKKLWKVDFKTRLQTDDLYKLIQPDLTLYDREKLKRNIHIFME